MILNAIRAFVSLWLVGCSASPPPHQPARAPGRYVEQLQSGGLDRRFILDVPPGYDGTKAVPVVLVFHGWLTSADEAETYTQMKKEGDAHGFVTVFPDGTGQKGFQGWNAYTLNLGGRSSADDVAFTTAILDRVEQEINVDKTREYVCGHSNGAFMANYLGAKLSSRLAAIGSVAGSIGVGQRMDPKPASPVSVILIHGEQDGMVSYGPNSHALLKAIGAQESAAWWASQDGCGKDPKETTSPSNVVTDLYTGGHDGTEVELVSIKNGGHSWPGGYERDNQGRVSLETTTGVSAADLIWSFFAAHPKPHV